MHQRGPGAGGRRAQERQSRLGALNPVPVRLLTSGRPRPSLRGASVCPLQDTALPRSRLQGGRDGTHRRISCLVRNVRSWKAKREGVQRGLPEAAPALPPAAGPRSRAHARTQALWDPGPAHLVLGQQILGQATARAPHRREHSSANSSRDAGNFLTSALERRHRPVPAATAPGATAPGPVPCFELPGDPGSVPPGGSGLREVPGELEAGPGAGPDAPARSPGLTAPPPGGRGGPAACSRAGCACVKAAKAPPWSCWSPRGSRAVPRPQL